MELEEPAAAHKKINSDLVTKRRRSDDNIAKQALQGTPQGRRERG